MATFRLSPNDFNIGKDWSGFIADDSGAIRQFADIGHLLDVRIQIEDRLLTIIPITGGGRPLKETIWHGGVLQTRWTRARGNVEFMTLTAMENYFAANLRPNFTVTFFVANKDGSIDRVLFSGGKLTQPNLGDYSGDKEVEQSIGISFTRGVVIGPNAAAIGASPLSFV